MTKKQQEEKEIDSVNITVPLKISLSRVPPRPALMGGSVHGAAAGFRPAPGAPLI